MTTNTSQTRGAAAAGTIVAESLTKVFYSTVRRSGRFSAVRSVVNPQRVAKTAVDAVSFRVDPGELVAFLGPNGAGKSTTIKMLTGILTPSSGRVLVNGMVPHADRIANSRHVGAVFGQRSQLWWDLPARDSLTVLRDIHGISPADFRTRIAEFDRILELSSFWDTRARQLSLGQRVRCDLAAALIHDPAVLYLDEPTIGMDVVVKEQVRNFLRDQVEQRGRTVVLTTHDMTEVERLAERVVLIDQGRIVYDGALEALRVRHQESGGDQGEDLEDIMRFVFESQRAEAAATAAAIAGAAMTVAGLEPARLPDAADLNQESEAAEDAEKSATRSEKSGPGDSDGSSDEMCEPDVSNAVGAR